MVFYKIEAIRKKVEDDASQNSRKYSRDLALSLCEKSEALFHKNDEQNFIFTTGIGEKQADFAAVIKNNISIEQLFEQYKKKLPFAIESYKVEEITFSAFNTTLSRADGCCYVNDDEDILNAFELSNLKGRYGRSGFGESIINDKLTTGEIYAVSDDLLFKETLTPEIDRIFAICAHRKPQGHPVHYILQTDDRETRKTVYRALLSALYKAGRVKNRRYCFVDYDEDSNYPDASFIDALYKSCENGTVIIRYNGGEEDEDQYACRSAELIEALCETAVKYKNKVLTVICLPKGAKKIKEEFLMNWGATAFIELYEDIVFGEKAAEYLNAMAKQNKIRADKNLTAALQDENTGYTATDLKRIFDKWYDSKLRSVVYPQYKTAETGKEKVKDEKPRGSAYDKLQQLIGLESAKSVMNQALNYFKAQRLFADRGLKLGQPSMHMVFTGNPGTAKTTVARLFARIMKENGLLAEGNLYEVGRADLVGKYVGHTAPLVKKAFERAKGSVLFIDEAYSLVDDRDGMYGDEAINTIVQEMENHRDDTVVIFAGYPDKMEGFLNKNPGLRSRIAFHIPFDDYNAGELCAIADLIAREQGFKLTKDATQKLEGIFDIARRQSDFGNGRYARNIIEKAKMAQANRLINMKLDAVTDEVLFTLCADDIEVPPQKSEVKIAKIGFCA